MRVATDVGGTFTDFVVLDPDLRTFKVPTGPDPQDGVLEGLADLDPASFVHASTVAANALIEGEGGPVALVTTKGFSDVVEIQTQRRRELYDLTAAKADPPVPQDLRFEVAERVDADGTVLVELVDDEVDALVDALSACDVRAVAVCTLFAHLNPVHERRIAERLREAGFVVSASHEVSPEVREYPRTATTAADAQVKGPVRDYVQRLRHALGDVPFRMLSSHGGLVRPARVLDAPVRVLLSGPVGGVAAARHLKRRLDLDRVLTLDMGGTSADLARLGPDGPSRRREFTFRDHPIRIPVVDVRTLGAGGGSIARLDPGGALVVGPESAGSDPGPAAYGRGGDEPTVTDADLVAGWVDPDRFAEGIALDPGLAETVVGDLADAAGMAVDAIARGIQRVVEANMAHAARRITLEEGHDPRRHALVTYGGAGPLHAWAVAERIDAPRVVVPPRPGVFSALGLLVADQVVEAARGIAPTDDLGSLDGVVADVVDEARREAEAMGGDVSTEVRLDLRYAGQGHALDVRFDTPDATVDRFHDLHDRVRGHAHPDRPVEATAVRARAVVPSEPVKLPGPEATGRPDPIADRDVLWPDGREPTPAFDRADLPAGHTLDGPAIVHDRDATCAVPPGWSARVDATGAIVMEVPGSTR